MVKVKDVIEKMEVLAPSFLKEDFDNVGLMVGDKEAEIKKILLALDCTKLVIEEAKEINADLIITHHPLIFRKPSKIVKDDLQGWKIIELIKNDIVLYSSHTNLDSAKDGINEEIVKILGFNEGILIEGSHIKGFEDSGLGRVVDLKEEMKVVDIIEQVKNKLSIANVRAVIGAPTAKKIAIINGSGQDFFNKALEMGADCIITGDTTYHFASDYKEMGITIIDAGHFSTEWIVFLKVMENIKKEFGNIEFVNSKKAEDPYVFM